MPNETDRLTLNIHPTLKADIAKAAAQVGVTQSEYVKRILEAVTPPMLNIGVRTPQAMTQLLFHGWARVDLREFNHNNQPEE